MSSEVQSGNIFVRLMDAMAKGDVIEGHEHNFDHTTIIFSGECEVEAKYTVRDEVTDQLVERTDRRTFVAPDFFLVKADVHHKFTAKTDGTTIWCVYSHRDAQGQVVQTFQGFTDAYV